MNKQNKLSFDKFFAKIKSIKHIEYIVIGIFALLAIVISYASFGETDKVTSSTDLFAYAKQQEEKLANTLSNISGCGKVKVMITYESGIEIVPAYSTDKIENKQDNGGNYSSNSSEKTTIIMSGGKPIILVEIEPKVKGVIVVSQGASNLKVKLELYKAVETLLDIDSNKIEIFVMK